MPAILRLYEDTLSADAAIEGALPAMPRMIFVVHGAATVAGRAFGDGEAWFGDGELRLMPGKAGVTCWRFELSMAATSGAARGRGVVSHEKLSVALDRTLRIGVPAGRDAGDTYTLGRAGSPCKCRLPEPA